MLLTHFVQCRFIPSVERPSGRSRLIRRDELAVRSVELSQSKIAGRHSRAQRRPLPLSSAAFWQATYARNSCFLTINAFLITVRQLLIDEPISNLNRIAFEMFKAIWYNHLHRKTNDKFNCWLNEIYASHGRYAWQVVPGGWNSGVSSFVVYLETRSFETDKISIGTSCGWET